MTARSSETSFKPRTYTGETSKEAETQTEATTLVKAGDTAPDFTVEMIDGSSVTLGSLKGKVVLLNFWATWCPPCREELTHVQTDIIDRFAGKHPVGNVGVQIHHVDPINKDEIVWTVNIQDLAIIGRLFNEGRVDMTKIIAVAGSEIERPQYVRVVAGAKGDSILKGNVKKQKEGDHVRIISGNVLTGTKTPADGFVAFYANQLQSCALWPARIPLLSL